MCIRDRSGRKERWHALRGDILTRAERPAEAHVAYSEARAALARLRPSQRQTRAMIALEAHVVRALSRSSSK